MPAPPNIVDFRKWRDFERQLANDFEQLPDHSLRLWLNFLTISPDSLLRDRLRSVVLGELGRRVSEVLRRR